MYRIGWDWMGYYGIVCIFLLRRWSALLQEKPFDIHTFDKETRASVKGEVLFIKTTDFPTVMGDWPNFLHTRNTLSTRTHAHKNTIIFLKKTTTLHSCKIHLSALSTNYNSELEFFFLIVCI